MDGGVKTAARIGGGGRAPERLHVPPETVEAQRRAADPRASAWVSANAGAGKTKVLTDRVVRLLLSGAPPARILCLTFTKAAAANMAIRIFERLGRWVTLDDAALATELEILEGEAPDRAKLRMARRLFARSVETPGGLKIETIHAFCERLLHLVPFEANVPARFAVLDDARAAELMEEVTANVLAEAARDERPDLADALAIVGVEATGDALHDVLCAAVKQTAYRDYPGGPAAAFARLRGELGLGPDETPETIERAMLEGGIPPEEWRALGETFAASKSVRDQAQGEAFLAALAATNPEERLAHYRSIFFKKDGDPKAPSTLATKGMGEALKDRLLVEQGRLIALDDRLKAALAFARTCALFTLAHEIRARIERQKAELGALDFDDLIAKTLALLARGDTAWVLYKLDRGIDHVLVDEAQDTNPQQWEILRLITAEFTAGDGARGPTPRTLFAVGDPKQSIYGFQGAAPREFESTRLLWRRKVDAAELRFEDVRLTLSFRSVRAVLSAVDAVFRVPEHFKGLSFEDTAVGTVHQSARPDAPGLVELWPVETPADEVEPEAWVLPLDVSERSSPPVVVARRVAAAVRAWTREGDEHGRRWNPGDILILVRKRNAAFQAVIRALKEAGIPVAGADRLKVGEHIAVLDLVAAGRAALLPADDLTLATALKSPLVGLTDDDLIRIAVGRGDRESLAEALERHADAGDVRAQVACAALQDWRRLAGRHGPFGFYAALLGPGGGRAALVARLGGEAGDAIDAFLCFAHAAEMAETPSLTAFLDRFQSTPHEIKRDLDSTRDEVRVMTVHGAKGLEAPVVVLIDGCDVLGRDPPLIPVDVKGVCLPVWSPGKNFDPARVADARDDLRARGLEEHNRLLYVAMTRAKDRLVIAPYLTGNSKTSPTEAWCEMVRRALVADARGLVLEEAPYGPIEVWREGEVSLASAPEADAPVPLPAFAEPLWLRQRAEPEPETAPPIRPSGALGAADRPMKPGEGMAAREARLRGTLIHALMEHLPGIDPAGRPATAAAFVAARAPRLDEEKRAGIVAAALGVLAHEGLGSLFDRGSRAEVPIAGRIHLAGREVPVSGQIDRLAVTPDAVLIADFKTALRPPSPGQPVPPRHAAQLALYRALLQEIYPDRPVRAYLVWTTGPLVRELGEAELAAALDTIAAFV